MKTLREAIEVNESNLPIILTTMGKPRIGLLPDLLEIHRDKIKDYNPKFLTIISNPNHLKSLPTKLK